MTCQIVHTLRTVRFREAFTIEYYVSTSQRVFAAPPKIYVELPENFLYPFKRSP